MTNAHRFKVSLFWHSSNVLDGGASATMTCQQFSNAAKAGLSIPTLDRLLEAEPGEVFAGLGRDETGYAEYHVLCVKPRTKSDVLAEQGETIDIPMTKVDPSDLHGQPTVAELIRKL